MKNFQHYLEMVQYETGDIEVKELSNKDFEKLQWGETFESNWYEAQSNCPNGWRVPTVEEVYTALKKNVEGFNKTYYWSSTEDKKRKNSAFLLDRDLEKAISNGKAQKNWVRCVK